jgi:hypothetical protein
LDKSDIETATSASPIHFAAAALASEAQPNKVDLSTGLPAKISITGTHLNEVSSVWLTSQDGKIQEEFKPSDQSDTSVSIEVGSASKVATVDASVKAAIFKISFNSAISDMTSAAKFVAVTFIGKAEISAGPAEKPKVDAPAAKPKPKMPKKER